MSGGTDNDDVVLKEMVGWVHACCNFLEGDAGYLQLALSKRDIYC